jgi:hypothetical protein
LHSINFSAKNAKENQGTERNHKLKLQHPGIHIPKCIPLQLSRGGVDYVKDLVRSLQSSFRHLKQFEIYTVSHCSTKHKSMLKSRNQSPGQKTLYVSFPFCFLTWDQHQNHFCSIWIDWWIKRLHSRHWLNTVAYYYRTHAQTTSLPPPTQCSSQPWYPSIHHLQR